MDVLQQCLLGLLQTLNYLFLSGCVLSHASWLQGVTATVSENIEKTFISHFSGMALWMAMLVCLLAGLSVHILTLCTDIHSSRAMNPNAFGNPLTFPLAVL